jgi:predicted transcriptional regulator
MTKEDLEAIFDRVRTWPVEKQAEAMEVLEWMDPDADFFEIPEEALPGIERGLAALEAGDIVPADEMAAFFAQRMKDK